MMTTNTLDHQHFNIPRERKREFDHHMQNEFKKETNTQNLYTTFQSIMNNKHIMYILYDTIIENGNFQMEIWRVSIIKKNYKKTKNM